ncbi:extracellular solute-binding protein [Hufsiella ginkgonis]|uniref:Extracellular solute-binding protein n=1 Tax=Hufsiella ginkgonis TaxID=2695274 RepID=A0A7K1XW64_9SPHI|nr:extracellular solute-binding protein [Hufsiella ginkgonis]MXV15222.1 extracellular solute-binding protein [Hufsiella ginkgonis]
MSLQQSDHFRIAVRKFGPFETMLQKTWDEYCSHSGCRLAGELVALDLHPLHQTLLTDGGLKNGDWDVAHISTDWLYEAYNSGSLEDLAPYLGNVPPEDFPHGWSESLLGLQQFGGTIGALPFHDGPECLIYRKDLFGDPREQEIFFKLYGKKLAPPVTWEEFRDIARFFNRPGEQRYGAVFACFPDGHNTVFDFSLQVWTRGGSLVNRLGQIDIDTPEAAEGLKFYRDMVNDVSAVHPGSAGFDSVAAGAAFARGEAAMMVNWFGFASVCEVSETSQVKGKVDITNVPAAMPHETASLNVYWLYAIGSGSRHKQTAYDFIRFALSKTNDRLLTLEGGIGCRISTWTDPEINQLIPYYHKLEELHRHARTLPLKDNWNAIAAVIDEVVLEATGTQKPINQLLARGQGKILSLNKA